MTIDWTQAPPWANYAAMDLDGCWFWYSEEPGKLTETWSPSGYNFEAFERSPIDWTQTLTQRPTT